MLKVSTSLALLRCMRFAWAGTALAAVAASSAWAQLSPGSLSKAHQSLNSPSKCIACHTLTTGAVKFKCLNCHSEIRERLNAQRGLHPRLVNQEGQKKECNACHAEHQGERFVPIRWDVPVEEFDHSKTGYALEGGHLGLSCRKCHAPKNISQIERRKMPAKNLTRTYLGLSRDCTSCHGDFHRGQVPADCLQCHTSSKWKPASKFDHTQAKFRPTGAHEKVACEKCHPKEGEPVAYVKFTGLKFETCDSCHKDPHRAAFSATCNSCHTDAAWKPANVAAQFDHSRAKFPLAGKHAGIGCAKCHRSSDFKAPVAHARCLDCHTSDAHGGQFANRGDGGECSSCHAVNGWKPTTFNGAAHQTTRYPLEGRHAALPCAKCHAPAGKATVYRVKFGQCADCHADKHNTQFAAAPHSNRCEDCHTVKGFERSTFTLAKHEQTRLPLEGAHAAVPCGECHNDPRSVHAQPGRFRFADVGCTTCHEDPHGGQFRERMATVAAGGRAEGCEACHSRRTWRDVSKFDHSTTAFKLAGTHRGALCEKCHPEAQPGGGIKSIVFRKAPQQCADCHEDVHKGQFAAGVAKVDCARCHALLQWKPATFTHDTSTSFALTGAHRGVECRSCHKTEQQAGGKRVLMFKAAPKDCGGCHGPEVRS